MLWLNALRAHQWLKNALVFLPAIAAHRVLDRDVLGSITLAFLSFSLCASAVYIINDIFDLQSDRLHPRKKKRPFASGALPVSYGWAAASFLLLAAALIALHLGPIFAATQLSYFAVSCSYTFKLKNQVIVDVMILALLYTFRVLAGSAATGIVPSFWLLAFSTFLFLSLAIVKRYSEMVMVQDQNKTQAAGRGYYVADMPVLLSLGAASAYSAVLILALYINSPDVEGLYSERWPLWLTLPPLLYWMTRIWLKAHRGELHDDPLVFAVTDKQSWVIAATVASALALATTRIFQ